MTGLPPRYRLLLLLKEREGEFVKGGEAARALGVSKTAIWKQARALRREGYPVEAVKGRGYRLSGRPKALLPFEVAWQLGTRWVAREVGLVHHRELVGSTQDWARLEAERGAPDGSVYIAEGQVSGRGRMGREWFSPEGRGIWMSVLLRPPMAPREALLLSLLAATATAEAVEAVAGVRALTKWPNDIVSSRRLRKMGGVLVEMAAEPDGIRWAVVGVGLNVNVAEGEFPPELRGKATSVAAESGREADRLAILRELLRRLDECYDLLLRGRGEEALERWRAREATIGRTVEVETEGGVVRGRALGATREGALLLATEGGREEVVWSGTVLMVE